MTDAETKKELGYLYDTYLCVGERDCFPLGVSSIPSIINSEYTLQAWTFARSFLDVTSLFSQT